MTSEGSDRDLLCSSRFNTETLGNPSVFIQLPVSKITILSCSPRGCWCIREPAQHTLLLPQSPMGSHGEATVKIKTTPWKSGCPGNLLSGFTTPAVSIHVSPRLAAHSRNQPELPHSATQKQGGIREQSRTAVCWVLLDSACSDREHFTCYLKKHSTSREHPSLLRKEREEEIKSSKQAPCSFPCLLQLPTRLLLHGKSLPPPPPSLLYIYRWHQGNSYITHLEN